MEWQITQDKVITLHFCLHCYWCASWVLSVPDIQMSRSGDPLCLGICGWVLGCFPRTMKLIYYKSDRQYWDWGEKTETEAVFAQSIATYSGLPPRQYSVPVPASSWQFYGLILSFCSSKFEAFLQPRALKTGGRHQTLLSKVVRYVPSSCLCVSWNSK